MNRSINEIEALAKKAARGAGMSWGLAEEAARSVASLEEMGLAGAEMLATLLQHNDRVDTVKLSPRSLSGTWVAPNGSLCPVVVGACLSDSARSLQEGGTINTAEVTCPLLILPFVKAVAHKLNVCLTLTWGGIEITTDGCAVAIHGDRQKLFVDQCTSLDCSVSNKQSVITVNAHRAALSEGCLNSLSKLAHRTYAPATEESRRLGAGAGQTDND